MALMGWRIFQLDAFTTRAYAGNPAAVVLLEEFASDDVLQAIAAENNLSETAFLVPKAGEYQLRWFTPTVEVPLCGHATLASAAVVLERLEPERDRVAFSTASGQLGVTRAANRGSYVMDFPVRPTVRVDPPDRLAAILGADPVDVHGNEFNYLVVLDSAAMVRELAPDMSAIARIDSPGMIVTALGDDDYDFVSRYFAPAKGIPEDPVTGSAHCMLAPYWASRLGKTEFLAYQASARGGEVRCRLVGDRVELEGSCVFYLEGTITGPS
jgi:PhzF family phenazine biosynthesis protein